MEKDSKGLPLSCIGKNIPPMGKPCVIRFSHRRRFPDLGFPIGGGRLPGQGFPIGGSRLPGQGFPIGILEEAGWLPKQGLQGFLISSMGKSCSGRQGRTRVLNDKKSAAKISALHDQSRVT